MITLPRATQLTASCVQSAPRKHTTIPLAITCSIAAVILVTLLTVNAQMLWAASATQNREVNVFAAADDGSSVVELVRDGSALVPIGEMTGAGGMKWFMVKTKSGNVGWIMASDAAEAKRIDDHFRALPKDSVSVGPVAAGMGSESSVTTAPASSTRDPASGAISIPIKMIGNSMVVPVTFSIGNSSVTGNAVVDTGASQTMVSKRMARELRLLSIAAQRRSGIGGTVLAEVGVVEAIKVGEAEVKNMQVSIHDFSHDQRYEGLLGFDFLGRFQLSVDSDKQVMVLTPRKK
jgi:hypothetical protein